MALMEWSGDLDIGVHEMNDQHKQILALMNQLYTANNANEPVDKLTAILNDLVNVTVDHFAKEERFMESFNFSEFSTHKILHQRLLTTLNEHKNDFLETKVLSPKFFDFLTFWLTSHIKGIDIKYADESRQKVA